MTTTTTGDGVSKDYFRNRVAEQMGQLKAKGYTGGVSFFVSASDECDEAVFRDASDMLDDFLSGNTTDITQTVR